MLWLWIALAQIALVAIGIARLESLNRVMREIYRKRWARGIDVSLAGVPGTQVTLGTGEQKFCFELTSSGFELVAADRRITIPEGVKVALWMPAGATAFPAGKKFRVVLEKDQRLDEGLFRTSHAVSRDAEVDLIPIERSEQARLDDELSWPGVFILGAIIAGMAGVGWWSASFAGVAGGISIVLLLWDAVGLHSFLIAMACERPPRH